MSKSNGNGLERTVKKIKYCRKKKMTRNNVKARLYKEAVIIGQTFGDY